MTTNPDIDGGPTCRPSPRECFERALGMIIGETSELIIVIPASRQLRAKRSAHVDSGGLSKGLEQYLDNYPELEVIVCVDRNGWAKYEIDSIETFCEVEYITGIENERIVGDGHIYLQKARAEGTQIIDANRDNLCRHPFENATVCFNLLFGKLGED